MRTHTLPSQTQTLNRATMKAVTSRWHFSSPSQQQQSPPACRPCTLRQGAAFSSAARPLPARPLAAPSQATMSSQAAAGPSTALESDLSAALSLANIRQSLIRQEDTIIFSLIERAQFARNDVMYTRGGIPVPGYLPDGRQLSFLEYLLRETEQIHGKIRRYTSPDEHAYFPDCIPPLVLPPLSYPQVRWVQRATALCCASCGSQRSVNLVVVVQRCGAAQQSDEHAGQGGGRGGEPKCGSSTAAVEGTAGQATFVLAASRWSKKEGSICCSCNRSAVLWAKDGSSVAGRGSREHSW